MEYFLITMIQDTTKFIKSCIFRQIENFYSRKPRLIGAISSTPEKNLQRLIFDYFSLLLTSMGKKIEITNCCNATKIAKAVTNAVYIICPSIINF